VPRAAVDLLHDRVFGCFTRVARRVRSKRSARTTSASRPTTRTGTTAELEGYCEKVLEGVPEEQRYKILRGNAIRMLELDRV
jgi:hypothetical protein